MRRSGWYLIIGQWNGAEVRVHFLAPLLAVFFPGRPASMGLAAGVVVVILAHELGHAVLVRWLGGVVHQVDVLPYGGECQHTGVAPGLHETIVAWGGILAQAVLLGAVELHRVSGPAAHTGFATDFLWALTYANFLIAAFNLLPIAPLDGAKAWRIVLLGPARLLGKTSSKSVRREPAQLGWFGRWRRARRLRRFRELQIELASREPPKGPLN